MNIINDKIIEFKDIKYYKIQGGYYQSRDRKCGNKLLHRVIWETYKGCIPNDYVVHHINEDPSDNRIENLECMTTYEHNRLHGCGYNFIGNKNTHWIGRKHKTKTIEKISNTKRLNDKRNNEYKVMYNFNILYIILNKLQSEIS